MITTIKPYGSISDSQIKYRYEIDGKYYVVDYGFNVLQIEEKDYMKLTCPVMKNPRKRGVR